MQKMKITFQDLKLKYNVTQTPKVFNLNKDREILMKNIGPEELEPVFEDIFIREELKRLK
jgi:hypothetical protein